MKQRIYIDTSVFGGYYDDEFSNHTLPLFNRIMNGEFVLIYSSVTQDELEKAPKKVKELLKNIKSDFSEFLETSNEVVELATEYYS